MVETRNGLTRFELIGDLERLNDWMGRHGNPDFRTAVLEELATEPRRNTVAYPDADLFRFKTVKSLTHGDRYFIIGFVIDDACHKVTIVYARSYSNFDKALRHMTSASLRGFVERLVETMVMSPIF